MRTRLASFLLVGAAFTSFATACNKPDPNASPSDAGYTETVTTASAGPTAIPPGNAPGGDLDASATTDAAPSAPFNQACAGPMPTVKLGADASASADPKAAKDAKAVALAGRADNLQMQALGAYGGTAASASGVLAGGSAPATCGDKPLPPCPMTAWMKANAGPAASNADSDLPALATVLDKIATFAPPGYTNWVSISKDGAAAARAGQLDAARASCRTCHTQYKAKYKAEMRPRPLP